MASARTGTGVMTKGAMTMATPTIAISPNRGLVTAVVAVAAVAADTTYVTGRQRALPAALHGFLA